MWRGGGAALRHIDIQCPNCGASINLGVAYSRPWPCSGRFPELGSARPGCNQDSKIMQRGAANLRVPEIQTALTIPPRSTRLHRLLEMYIIQGALFTSPSISTKQDLIVAVQRLAAQGLLSAAVVTEVGSYPDQNVAEAIHEIRTGNQSVTPGTFRTQELAALRYAAANGAPPQPSSSPGGPPQFEVVRQEVRTIPLQSGRRLRVTPVNRLRVVMVQTGYRRVPAGDLLASAAVDRVYDDGQREWYPGVELFGEGIFIDLGPDPAMTGSAWHFPLRGPEWTTWMAAWTDPEGFGQNIRPDEQDQLHPVFVWWHTLAHRLINALSVDSGYSSAAVRERVFIDINRQTGEATGGVLLYTAQPGGDGTLGGLVALVPEFQRVLDNGFRNIDSCSNDPLCGEEEFAAGKYNGAACYACSLVSETSCEHRNMRLDRNLLLANLP